MKYLKPNPKPYLKKLPMIERERQVKQSKNNGRKENLLAMMMILIPGEHIVDTMVLLKLMMSMLTFLHLTSRILWHATTGPM